MRIPKLAGTMAVSLLVSAIGAVQLASGSERLHGPFGSGDASSSPCGMRTSAPAYTHVVWVMMENHSYGDIINSSSAPYINSLASECGLATNYHNITHPSLPNYVAATAGLGLSDVKQFKKDCNPSNRCSTEAPSIFGQGEGWKAYEESMPSACDPTDAGEYAVRHNPPPYFRTPSGCVTFDVPYAALAADLTNGALPAFSFVTPNLIDDMHDGTVADGDAWLAANLPAIFNSTIYKSGTTAVFLTWDEGEGGSSLDCAINTTDVGCHVATIVISPSTVSGTTSADLFNHYSLLGTTEELLGLPKLGLAASASSMASAFNL
jgi:phosphatidylinositol-3-phosphatase